MKLISSVKVMEVDRYSVMLRFICLTVLLFAMLAMPTPGGAAIYKCIDESGNTTYTGSPCALDESTTQISKFATAVPGQDCRIARKYALDTAQRMQQGEDSEQLFDSYGGINHQTPFIIGLTSYIYSFSGNATASASRIATLSTERCQVGSFGGDSASCDTYPPDFIASQGGCDALQGKTQQAMAAFPPQKNAATTIGGTHDSTGTTQGPADAELAQSTQADVDMPLSYVPPELGRATPASSHRASTANTRNGQPPDTDGGDLSDCKARITQSIADTASQMRLSQSAASQDRLRARMQQLKRQLGDC